VKLGEIVEGLSLERLTPKLQKAESVEVSAGHVSDLLSDVLANAPEGCVLVTIQAHMNVIAVSIHAGLCAVIFASDLVPEKEVIQKALEEKMPLFSAKYSSFDIVGRLYALGLRGSKP